MVTSLNCLIKSKRGRFITASKRILPASSRNFKKFLNFNLYFWLLASGSWLINTPIAKTITIPKKILNTSSDPPTVLNVRLANIGTEAITAFGKIFAKIPKTDKKLIITAKNDEARKQFNNPADPESLLDSGSFVLKLLRIKKYKIPKLKISKSEPLNLP